MSSAPTGPIGRAVIHPGQRLWLRWRECKVDHQGAYQHLRRLKLVPGENGAPPLFDYPTCFCTLYTTDGISLFIARGYSLGGDISAYLPAKQVRWQVFFEPSDQIVESYAKTFHFTTIFPWSCV